MKSRALTFISTPIMLLTTALFLGSIMPYYQADDFGYYTELSFAMLLQLFIAAISMINLVLAGGASNSKYGFIGCIRSGGQMLAYELVISAIKLIIIGAANTISYSCLVQYQVHLGLLIPALPLYLIFLAAVMAETNRAPFDLPEAESELVSGFNTEHSAV